VAVFGDPFNGAPVKGIPRDRVKTFCNAGDGVCGGSFTITASHLSYTMNGDISAAASWIKAVVKKV
jgi:cutinase